MPGRQALAGSQALLAKTASAVVAALFLAASLAAGAIPQPASSPLKTIIDVKARTLCRTLAEHVQPAVAGLMKNDRMIDLSVSVLDKTAADMTGGGSINLDMLQLKNVALALNRNVETIDKILDDPAHFPLHPNTPDEWTEDEIKQDLLKILTRQKLVVNALYGTADTHALASMQNDFPENNPVVNPTAAPVFPADQALTLISSAGLEDKHVIDLVKAADSSLIGRSLYGQLAGLIVLHQAETQPYETQTADDVREPALECSDDR
jgi:hypothetical protein